MEADNKPNMAEVRSFECLSHPTQRKEEQAMVKDKKEPILPLALRETEITEGDFEVMLRVARDKNATSGRYRGTPKRVPSVKLAVAKS